MVSTQLMPTSSTDTQTTTLPAAPAGYSYLLVRDSKFSWKVVEYDDAGVFIRPLLWKVEELDEDGTVISSKAFKSQRDIAREFGVGKDFICQMYKGNIKHGWKKRAEWKNRRIVHLDT